MKAVIYDRKGKPDKLVFCDMDKPVPSDDEVLIKIHAVSLNAVTALQALRDKAGIQKWKRVLIVGSSGGVVSDKVLSDRLLTADILLKGLKKR